MDSPKTVTNTILINASPKRVWAVLTEPFETKQYMFGCETVTDWKVGSPLLWEAEYEGKKVVFVKGNILEILPENLLRYSEIENNPPYADILENHLIVQYDLTEKDGVTELTVTQSGFENAAEGEKRYLDVYNNGLGWSPILEKIKMQAEVQRTPKSTYSEF